MTPNRIIKLVLKCLRHRPHELGLVDIHNPPHIGEVVNGLHLHGIFLERNQLIRIIEADHQRRLYISDYKRVYPTYGKNSADLPLTHFGRCATNYGDPLWYPTTLSWLKLIYDIEDFRLSVKSITVFAKSGDASNKAYCYRKKDTPIIVKLKFPYGVYVLKGKSYLSVIKHTDIIEAKEVLPAMGYTWEQARANGAWAYSPIPLDKQKR